MTIKFNLNNDEKESNVVEASLKVDSDGDLVLMLTKGNCTQNVLYVSSRTGKIEQFEICCKKHADLLGLTLDKNQYVEVG